MRPIATNSNGGAFELDDTARGSSFIPTPPNISKPMSSSPEKSPPNSDVYPPPPPNMHKSMGVKQLVGVGAGSVLAIGFIIAIVHLIYSRMKSKKSIEIGGTLTYKELGYATGGFSKANIVGEGGFGLVYRGRLYNGQEVAIKRLKPNSRQGQGEFQVEIDVISHVHHRHLVSLVGFCVYGAERLLAYEFVPNNTLEYHLRRENGSTLDWPRRMHIAIASAKVLAYLHEHCNPSIIHRDIKSSNVLIDSSFEPKLSDLGLAKLNPDNTSQISMATGVKGTFGYLAPEYANTAKVSVKSDVYSFGVLLLEVIKGKGPLDSPNNDTGKSLVDWAREILDNWLEGKGNLGELVDSSLDGHYVDSQQLGRMAICIAACINHSAKNRPRMSEVVRALEEDESIDDLKERLLESRGYNYDNIQYKDNIRKLTNVAMSGLIGGESSTPGSSKVDEPSTEV